MNKNKINFIGYILYLLVIVLLVDYLLYRIYIRRFDRSSWPNKTLSSLEKKIGCWPLYPLDKKSYYSNFQPEKSLNTIRVGCFGASFTYGNSVGDKFDYPSLLQRALRGQGYGNVEVLNFGRGWNGFHQSHMIWEMQYKKYGLDYTILDSFGFWEDRELTFNHTMANENSVAYPYYCHSRYILKKDGKDVERIDFPADSMQEAIRKYLRFCPTWECLRYDIHAPMFLSAPLKLLFPDKAVLNPFYYAHAVRDEAKKINTFLLGKIAEDSNEVFLPMWKMALASKALPVMPKEDNFNSVVLPELPDFLYSMPSMHKSPAGNYFLAQAVAAYLRGEESVDIDTLLPQDIDDRDISKADEEKHPLSYYSSIWLEANGVVLAKFYDIYDNISKPFFTDISSVSCVAFLGIKGAGQSNLEALFVPIDFELKNVISAKIFVYDARHRQVFSKILPIVALHKDLNISFIDMPIVKGYASNAIILEDDYCGYQFKAGDNLVISVDGKDVFSASVRGYLTGGLCLRVSAGYWAVIRGLGGSLPDINMMPDNGVVYLAMKSAKVCQKVPFARYTKQKITIKFDRKIKNPIKKPETK